MGSSLRIWIIDSIVRYCIFPQQPNPSSPVSFAQIIELDTSIINTKQQD